MRGFFNPCIFSPRIDVGGFNNAFGVIFLYFLMLDLHNHFVIFPTLSVLQKRFANTLSDSTKHFLYYSVGDANYRDFYWCIV